MYKTEKIIIEIENEPKEHYAVINDDGFYYELSGDEITVNFIADLLNNNDVEICHAADIIEDYIYS